MNALPLLAVLFLAADPQAEAVPAPDKMAAFQARISQNTEAAGAQAVREKREARQAAQGAQQATASTPAPAAAPVSPMMQLVLDAEGGLIELRTNMTRAQTARLRLEDYVPVLDRLFREKKEANDRLVERLRTIRASNAPIEVKDAARNVVTSWGAYTSALAVASPRDQELVTHGSLGTAYKQALAEYRLEVELAGL